ncbi:MAG: family transposase [Firmicutes bacterium]|nr:family transposase [Bacillota bacterium]
MDFLVSKHRDKDAAKNFFRKALRATHNQQPRVITTDKYAATEVAINEMIYSGIVSVKATIRKIRYLNNIIEQDHRFIKRKVKPMLGFGSFKSAEKTICEIEIMHMIRKGQVEGIQYALSEVEFFNKIMGISA